MPAVPGEGSRHLGGMGMRRPLAILLALVLMVGLFAASTSPRRAAAEGLQSVTTWATVKSTAPAIGCTIPVTVEVREGGNPLEAVNVLAGVVIDGAIISSARASTDATGLAYLDLDTTGAYPGGDARVEINLDGTYVGRVDLAFSDGGACDSAASVLSANADIWWTGVATAMDDTSATSPDTTVADTSSDTGVAASGSGTSFWVPTYVQQRNLSCEYASIHIATAAWGGDGISEYALDSAVGWSENPHDGYRGDITGWWGNTTDYGVYAEALSWALPQFGYSGEVFYGQGDPGALTARLDQGLPTLVWIGEWGDTGFYETGADGSSYLLVPGAHVVVAYGYDANGVSISDPASGSYITYDWGRFMAMWNVFDGMALAVSPA